jgi:cytochrome c55X
MLGEIKLGLGMSLLLGVAIGSAAAQATVSLAPVREQALIRMVRQDCGSCHGMLLTGGLGPALTPEALADKPVESLAATIYHGRPGTPMPPWKAMLNEAEADWIAQRLLGGFPQESRR